ncbi:MULTISPECIES: aminotransferase class I/II-fold pyridoxal phosphate-dependent enzyme [unclassified Streptomyces]|uniref:8-amino-7-oxononanoate synthase n=2 Tax=Streptomyces sp. NBC_00060 TaxID=2975636 RepID=A0AAU2HEB0_9ACTN
MPLHRAESCPVCVRYAKINEVGNPYYRKVTGKSGTTIEFDGEPTLLAAGNDYLDLSTDPRVTRAAHDAIDRYGVGITGSPLMNGYLDIHAQLEDELAEWVGKEAGMVFAAGLLANVGPLSQIIRFNYDTAVVSDESIHASLIDGIRLGRPKYVARFAHNDVSELRAGLQKVSEKTSNILIVVEGTYSVEGDLAALPDIVAVAREFGAEIFLDDAHGVGVLGAGRGTAAHFGLADQIDYITGTFSKSFGSSGGFLCTSREAMHHFAAQCPSHMFAAALAPALTAAALCALEIMRQEPHRSDHALHMANTLREELRALGFDATGVTPVVPVSLKGLFGSSGDLDLLQKEMIGAIEAQSRLLSEHGVYANPFIPPGSPDPLLRLSVTAGFDDDDIKKIVDAFAALRETIPGFGTEQPAS